MKKLMTIAAAAFCASAMASESGIVSANIVGYGDKTTENFEFIGPSFLKIGDDQQSTYADIKVNCDETGEGDGSGWQPLADGIILLDEYGTFVRRLVYLPEVLAEEEKVTKGWYDNADASKSDYSTCWNEKPLIFGEAIQIAASEGVGAKATFAGQVKESPTVVDVENFMSVANCAPIEIKIGDIIVNCDETGEGDGSGWQPLSDGIILLDKYGTFERRLVYLPQVLAEEENVTKGWYDNADVSKSDYSTCWNEKQVFAAGGGFQVAVAAGTGATVTIKSALATETK